MRKVIIVLIAGLALVACSQPTEPTKPTKTIVAVNSLWQVVKKETTARAADGETLVDYVANYNSTTIDDFLRLYEEGQVPDIHNAPPVSVFIVNPLTYAINWSAIDVPRISLVENADAWRADAHGQLLFIDHVPPKPVYPWESTPYEWYAIYAIDGTGKIIYEDHSGYNPDESFSGQWITTPSDQYVNGVQGGGWATIEAYHYQMMQIYQTEVATHPGWRLITQQLYTEPSYINN